MGVMEVGIPKWAMYNHPVQRLLRENYYNPLGFGFCDG
jgi:hypothetical protein